MTGSATPEQRALAAAEAIAAGGDPVTARGVQQLARVGMKVATPVARAWNEQHSGMPAATPVPDQVRVRFEAMWREAVHAAGAAHASEVEEWTARLAASQEDLDRVATHLAGLEAELAAAQVRAAEAQAQTDQVRAELRAAEAVAARAENRAAAAEGLVAGLREALAALPAVSAPPVAPSPREGRR